MQLHARIFPLLILLGSILLSACQQEEWRTVDMNKGEEISLHLKLPKSKTWSDEVEINLTCRELNTHLTIRTQSKDSIISLRLPVGYYQLRIDMRQAEEGQTTEPAVYRALHTGLTVEPRMSNTNIYMELSRVPDISKGLVIAEIFPTGTKTPDGKQFDADKYIMLFNQSNETIYLDGLCLSTGAYLTNLRINPQPNIMQECVAIDAILRIPGGGTDHPLKPRGYCIIADNAADHREANPLSWNANNATFEFFWPGEHDDIDNPKVPNLEILYDFIVMNNQASQAFIIWRIPDTMTKQDYLQNYIYDYFWMFVQGEYTVKMDERCYRVPNEWVVDAVNLSPFREFEWTVVAPALDASYTYCADIGLSEDRYYYGARRIVEVRDPAGFPIRMRDDNDSQKDFLPRTKASLLMDAPPL